MKTHIRSITAALLSALMLLSLCACGAEKTEPETVEIGSALELMETVWSAYGDGEKFPAVGGDFSEENMKTDAPGKFGVEDAAALENLFCVPESGAALIDDAATLVHMMNTNTISAAAFRCVDSADSAKLAELIKAELENRHWVCGMPDKFLICSLGGYVVSVYGADELVDTFKAKLSETYPALELLAEQRIG